MSRTLSVLSCEILPKSWRQVWHIGDWSTISTPICGNTSVVWIIPRDGLWDFAAEVRYIYFSVFFCVCDLHATFLAVFFFKHHSAWRSPRIAGPPSEEALQPSPRSPRERGASDSRLGEKTVESGGLLTTWVWVNTYRYIFSGMNIHLPAILMWTTGVQGFDTLPPGIFGGSWSRVSYLKMVGKLEWSCWSIIFFWRNFDGQFAMALFRHIWCMYLHMLGLIPSQPNGRKPTIPTMVIQMVQPWNFGGLTTHQNQISNSHDSPISHW